MKAFSYFWWPRDKHGPPGFWFRIFGYGLHVKVAKGHRPLFSERYGYVKPPLYIFGLTYRCIATGPARRARAGGGPGMSDDYNVGSPIMMTMKLTEYAKLTADLAAARERIAKLEEQRDSWHDLAVSLEERLVQNKPSERLRALLAEVRGCLAVVTDSYADVTIPRELWERLG